jgi:uncharacterized membrane protein YagU involved in acid resistance
MGVDTIAKLMPPRRRLMGAILGGLVAGFVLAVWLVVGEVVTRTPSQLTMMERQIAAWFDGATPIDAPMIKFAEEYVGIAGHLALSAVVAAVYPFVWRRDRSVVLNGLLFGAGFFIAAHAVIGPLLRLTPGMWNFSLAVFVQGCIINGFFGLCTAFFAHQFDVGGAARVITAGSDAQESGAFSTH